MRSRSSQPSSRATRRSTLFTSAASASRRRPTSSIRVPGARHSRPPTATTAPRVSQSGSMLDIVPGAVHPPAVAGGGGTDRPSWSDVSLVAVSRTQLASAVTPVEGDQRRRPAPVVADRRHRRLAGATARERVDSQEDGPRDRPRSLHGPLRRCSASPLAADEAARGTGRLPQTVRWGGRRVTPALRPRLCQGRGRSRPGLADGAAHSTVQRVSVSTSLTYTRLPTRVGWVQVGLSATSYRATGSNSVRP